MGMDVVRKTEKSYMIIEGAVLRTVIGDIAQIGTVEAIVNCGNKKLTRSTGGVNERIHDAAGPNLQKECEKLNGCEIGEAKITSAYNLQCKAIIHTVGPVWEGGNKGETEKLRLCYLNSLFMAMTCGISKVAFPSISTGLYAFPLNLAADIAIQSVADFLHVYPRKIREVVWVLYSSHIKAQYDFAMEKWYRKFLTKKGSAFHMINVGEIQKTNSVKRGDELSNPTDDLMMPHYVNAQQDMDTPYHCIDDLHLLKRTSIKKVVIKGEHYLFPTYRCPKCQAEYTSVSQLKDQLGIKLGGITYRNILKPKDKTRLKEYCKIPHVPEEGSRCFVHMAKPGKCLLCGYNNLQNRLMIHSTKKGKKVQYAVKYCQYCDVYYIKHTLYSQYKDDWLLINAEDYETFQAMKKQTIQKETAKSEGTEKPIIKHNNTISINDFVVRRNTFKCLHNDHQIRDLTGKINIINQKGEIQQLSISVGYCPQCNIFFILESTYEYLKNKGTPLCRISSEKAYLKGIGNYNGMKLAQESILMQHGYTVSQEEGLSPARRQKILAVLIDNKILTKNDIISYLDFFISQKKSNHKFEKAISKWQNDREFVAEYKIGMFKMIDVNGIYLNH